MISRISSRIAFARTAFSPTPTRRGLGGMRTPLDFSAPLMGAVPLMNSWESSVSRAGVAGPTTVKPEPSEPGPLVDRPLIFSRAAKMAATGHEYQGESADPAEIDGSL